jgi:hypothetical protein
MHGAASGNETGPEISKDRAIPTPKKYQYISASYEHMRETTEPLRRSPFLPGGKICRLRPAKAACVIASREYGLY